MNIAFPGMMIPYKDSHYKDEMDLWQFYLHHGDIYNETAPRIAKTPLVDKTLPV